MQSPEHTEQSIQAFVDGKRREDHQLEYRAADAFKNPIEITVDVSAFANASGGLIIYGVGVMNVKFLPIYWTLFADNAEPKEGETEILKIPRRPY
jgi:hypothetical protein